DGDGVVVQGVEVDGHAVRGADLVLTTVAAADGAGGVVVDVPQTAQLVGDLLRGRGQGLLLRQRQDGDLHRGQARGQLEDGACVGAARGVRRLLRGGGIDEEGHQGPAQAGCRLDYVRDAALFLLLVVVGKSLAGALGVGAQVEVRAVIDALEL